MPASSSRPFFSVFGTTVRGNLSQGAEVKTAWHSLSNRRALAMAQAVPGRSISRVWQALASRQSDAGHGYHVAPDIETPGAVVCSVSPGQTVHLMVRKTFQYVSSPGIAVHVAALSFELATQALAV